MIRSLFLSLCFISPLVAQSEKPNVLFIFADDMTYTAIGALGHPEVKTPHLDELFNSGTRLSHVYNSGGWNGAICIASRTMLMTGRTLWNAHSELDQIHDKKLWPHLMENVGYKSYMTGKWHIEAKADKSFQVVGDVRPGMPVDTPYKKGYHRPKPGEVDVWDPTDKSNGGFWEGGKHWSEVEADSAIGFLGQAKKEKNPFFIYLAFNAPHDPRQSPQEFLDLYPVDKMQVPKNFRPAYPYREAIGSSMDMRDEALAAMPRTEHSIQVHRREYFALITHLDAQIGRVLKALDENGQRDNTIIVFTADHGLSVGRHGLLGKQNPYDHSIRVPYVICGPGIAKNKTIDTPVYVQDSLPTLLDLAGVDVPKHVQFKSFAPHLKGEGEKTTREQIYYGYMDTQRALVKDGYKLIVYPKGFVARLYNLKADPLEMDDLLARGEGQQIAKKLLAALKAESKSQNDSMKYPPFTWQ